jgi:hypothetical protein
VSYNTSGVSLRVGKHVSELIEESVGGVKKCMEYSKEGPWIFLYAVYEFFSSCSLPICVQTLENSKAAYNDDEKNGVGWGGGGFPHIIDDLKRKGAKLYVERFPLSHKKEVIPSTYVTLRPLIGGWVAKYRGMGG